MSTFIDPRTAPSNSSVPGVTRTLQIIVTALVLGVALFAGFVIFAGHLQQPPQGTILSYFAVGFGALMVVLHVVVPAVVERAAIANQSVGASPDSLVQIFFIRTIIAAALLDGAAFLSLVAAMTEHQPWVLGVTAVLIVLMLMQIPTRTRVEHWLESRLMERSQ